VSFTFAFGCTANVVHGLQKFGTMPRFACMLSGRVLRIFSRIFYLFDGHVGFN
jgi:hypothetical protein